MIPARRRLLAAAALAACAGAAAAAWARRESRGGGADGPVGDAAGGGAGDTAGGAGGAAHPDRRGHDGHAAAGVPDEVCIVAPTWAPQSLDVAAPERPAAVPADARCPVCGMYPSRWPRWASQVRFDDGHAHFTDSPLCLFHYLQAVPRHAPGRTRAQIAGAWVGAHDGSGWVPLARAHFVHGSSAAGPMRRLNLPAFRTPADAAAFATRHGGRAFASAALLERLPAELQRLAPHREHAEHAGPG